MNSLLRSRRAFVALLLPAAFACAAPSALAKAAYAGEEEMIAQADAIAIVEVTAVEETKFKGRYWTYREAAHATVQQTLKGALPQQVKLYGGEDFICAQVHFKPGRHLVFLSHDGDVLIGCNWHLSVRPIKGDQVEWYLPGKYMGVSWQPLGAVLERIQKALPPAKKP